MENGISSSNKLFLFSKMYILYNKLDNIIPPIVNNIMKPNDHKTEIFNFNFAPWYVANHLKILIPVGTAIIIVAEIKNMFVY